MALRDSSTSGDVAEAGGTSAVSELPAYRDSADVAAKTVGWLDGLFMVAANAKYSIPVDELMWTVAKNRPRSAVLIKNLN